jgi:arylsulfatase A-like enzyme/Flp pilus assembly protein TadD
VEKGRFSFFLFFFLLWPGIFSGHSLLFPAEGQKESRKNLVLVTVDTLRADRLSCYSREHLSTPNIDRLAEKGVLFTKAFAHSSTTLTSLTNILLGVTPLYHGVHDNASFIVSERFLTLAEHLKSYGYTTGAFIGAYPLDSRFGLNQGFDIYDDDYGAQDFQKFTYVERKAETVVSKAIAWLKEQSPPFFIWIHCFDPHAPYQPPPPFDAQYKNNLYDGEVAYVDSVLGGLFGYVENSSFSAETVIIFSADHGESLGEHGEETHGFFAYNSTIWIPLVICGPGIGRARVEQIVSHIDIFPTVCDLLGIKKPSFLQGRSLLPALKGKKLPESPLYFESLYPYYSRGWAPLRGYIRGGEKFIDSPLPEVYDLNKDFNELRNLAQTKKIENYRKELSQIIKTRSLPETSESKIKIDRDSLDKLKSLGYISSFHLPQKENFGPKDDVKILLPYHNRAMEAVELYNKGRVDEGIGLLKKMLKERNDVDIIYTNLAALLKSQGRLKEALELLKLGLEKLPSSYEIFITYISSLIHAGEYDEAIKVFNENSLPKIANDPEIWNSIGVAYSQKGDFEKSLDFYQKALSLDDDYPKAFNNLGSAYLSIFLKTKDPIACQKSIENFKKAIELDPDYASAYNGLGAAYLQAGNLEGAVSCLEKALSLNPDTGQATYNLGLAYMAKGDNSRALDYFNKYKMKYSSSLSLSEKNKLEELIEKCKKNS